MNLSKVALVLSLILAQTPVFADVRTTLFADGLSFISPDYTEIDTKNFLFLGVKFKSDPRTHDAFKVDFTGRFGVNKTVLSTYNPREVAYTFDRGESSQIHIGRKLHIWSALDSFWNYSLFQPTFEWNQLDPENQGLTGVFYQLRGSAWSLMLYASPLYIPDQGANYEIKDGQFSSGNPFFQPPPQNLRFQGQLLPIDYNIERPKNEDVVLNSSYGVQFRYGESKGVFAQAAAMVKPSNQLALGYKGVLVTTRVRVDVNPKVYYENLYSADLGYRDDWGFAVLSAVHDKPQNPDFDSSYNSPQFEASTIWGPQFLYKYEGYQFILAYIDTTGGQITEVGPDTSTDRRSLSERFLFKQAAVAQLSYGALFTEQLRWDTNLRYKWSTKEGHRHIGFRNDFKLGGDMKNWAFWVDLLLIDTNSDLNSAYESYKNRDQIWLGASYAL